LYFSWGYTDNNNWKKKIQQTSNVLLDCVGRAQWR